MVASPAESPPVPLSKLNWLRAVQQGGKNLLSTRHRIFSYHGDIHRPTPEHILRGAADFLQTKTEIEGTWMYLRYIPR